MIKSPDAVKRYASARERFLKPAIINYIAKNFSHQFSPFMRELIVDKIIGYLNEISPESQCLRPGQLLWLALDKDTRGDSPNRRFVPVILDLVTDEDVNELTKGVSPSVVGRNALARMFRQAFEQGGVLSTRDAALFLHRHTSGVSDMRITFEKEHECVLPHTGVIHDMGSSISHKTVIIKKTVFEMKDPASVAREVNHSQKAVDRYRKDFFRVRTAFLKNPDLDFVSFVTGLRKFLVKQYIRYLNNEKH